MTYTPHGKHFIAGSLVDADETFIAETTDGTGYAISRGRTEDVNRAAEAASFAFSSYAQTAREVRANFLNTVADELELRAEPITAIAMQETGLPEARLQGERDRTVGQLRLFANLIQDDIYLDKRQQQALPDRAPAPGPEHKLIQRPIGPVAVFGASNFPLAFSTLGGDTASALAAGCPVVVKGHPAHPGTGELAAEAITTAIRKCDLDAGVFSMIHDSSITVGTALVQHPLIKAVGFTGSQRAGRALFDLCAARAEPIPFFGEMGSVNPVFVLPEAAKNRGAETGAAWAASLTMGAGQFCTNPGIVIGLEGTLDAFLEAAEVALKDSSSQIMLTSDIANVYASRVKAVTACADVECIVPGGVDGRSASAVLCKTSFDGFQKNETLHEEVFGPFGLVVEVSNTEQLHEVARGLDGQLTCTLQMHERDTKLARSLIAIVEHKAGRILANGFPTGVEVSHAMVHGGPYPASTNFGATSVGTMAIRRFMRPVCYQNIPDGMLVDW